MLELEVGGREGFNNETNEFFRMNAKTVRLEHSLISVSKWESKWQIPFINTKEFTDEQTRDYIRCMVISTTGTDDFVDELTRSDIAKIRDYIDSPMTATTFREANSANQKHSREIITSELIYYWMIAYNIPFECQKWHLNRLLTLIRICGIKNDTSENKKMSKKDIYSQNRALNEARRKASGSKG